MIRHLLLALLIFGLAIPAAALPVGHHGPQVSSEHHHHGQPDKPAPAKAKHECIGCIAPYQGVTAPDAPLETPGLRLLPALSPRMVTVRAGPETPPPKA